MTRHPAARRSPSGSVVGLTDPIVPDTAARGGWHEHDATCRGATVPGARGNLDARVLLLGVAARVKLRAHELIPRTAEARRHAVIHTVVGWVLKNTPHGGHRMQGAVGGGEFWLAAGSAGELAHEGAAKVAATPLMRNALARRCPLVVRISDRRGTIARVSLVEVAPRTPTVHNGRGGSTSARTCAPPTCTGGRSHIGRPPLRRRHTIVPSRCGKSSGLLGTGCAGGAAIRKAPSAPNVPATTHQEAHNESVKHGAPHARSMTLEVTRVNEPRDTGVTRCPWDCR